MVCGFCKKPGHTRASCGALKEMGEKERQVEEGGKTSRQKCGNCRKVGHNRRTCTRPARPHGNKKREEKKTKKSVDTAGAGAGAGTEPVGEEVVVEDTGCVLTMTYRKSVDIKACVERVASNKGMGKGRKVAPGAVYVMITDTPMMCKVGKSKVPDARYKTHRTSSVHSYFVLTRQCRDMDKTEKLAHAVLKELGVAQAVPPGEAGHEFWAIDANSARRIVSECATFVDGLILDRGK